MAQMATVSGVPISGDAAFLEDLYARYRRDPAALDPSWRDLFGDIDRAAPAPEPGAAAAPEGAVLARTRDNLRVLMLIRAYRVRGHLIANLDPLGLDSREHHPELDPASYGFTDADYDREFFIDGVLGRETARLREILEVLKQVYCDRIGIEFMHIQHPEEKAWIQRRVENSLNRTRFSRERKLDILHELERAEGFERFLHVKYPATKRFSIEGAESVVPALEAIIRASAAGGVEEIVFGMPHRGRINVLTTVMGKSYGDVFAEFQGNLSHAGDVQGSGDVKYHLGTSSDRVLPDGRRVHMSMTANPSHLEWVNPVVMGRVRAKQETIGDNEHRRVMGVLMHGDAAFAGQGVVAETLGLSELRGHRTGGTVHIIVNNQIGFTTSPRYARSSPYPSDVAKTVQAPIVHANGDDPEAVVHAAALAADFRARFHRDVVLDIFCYRRHGHNENDEPGFTQPLMYRRIADHPTTRQIYAERLVGEGALTPREAEKRVAEVARSLERDHDATRARPARKADWLEGKWAGFEVAPAPLERRAGDTGVETARLREIGEALCRYPQGFAVHRKIDRFNRARRAALQAGENLDWATAEALAFGSLLLEGHAVRLSGQDSGRGTFSQRHSVIVDQSTEERHIPLNFLAPDQARFEVTDSILSEAAVLGYEYGFSLADPNALVLWEAQFGDFANTAQAVIDNFIAAGESKWLRMSGLVMLLPHGYEGQGPEHSSARLERYLQLYAEDNIQVANCTTPANYFHILRRQIHRKFRKPLILMTPKSLLRHKRAVSRLDELRPGGGFRRVLPDPTAPARARRVVLCSGKVYYDLAEAREERGVDDVALVRIEQLTPFPERSVATELAKYPDAETVWCQEEPRNMGAWGFVAPHLETLLRGRDAARAAYVGRAPSASTAAGAVKAHRREQADLVRRALDAPETSGQA